MEPLESLEERLPPEFRERYQLREKLGAGASADVFRAVQLGLDRPVVVKLVWDLSRSAEGMLDRVLQEARLLADLSHPHVIALLDHGVHGDVLYLTYPDEEGRPLVELLEGGGPRDPEWVAGMLRQILEGLAFLHEKGVLHRDLKPANVLVVGAGEVRLIDLGLAKDLEGGASLTQTGAILGTPGYMSPEQLEGHPAEARDDLYAVGVMAYEMLTGKNPFRGEDLQHTIVLHQTHDPPPVDEVVPGVPAELVRLVDGLLRKRRQERPDSAATALAILSGDLVDESDEADATEILGLSEVAYEARTEESEPDTHAEMRIRTSELDAAVAPEQEEVPAQGRARFGPWIAIALGALALGAGLGRFRAHRAAPPRPVTRPPPTPEPGLGEWGKPYVKRAEAELREVQRWSVDHRGRPVKDLVDPFRKPLPFLSPDPLRAGRLDRELVVAARFQRWMLDGGRPEEMDPGFRGGLERVDAGYAAHGTFRPFFPFLYLQPRSFTEPIPQSFPSRPRHPEDVRLEGRASGWLATALDAFDRAFKAREEMRDALERPEGELARMVDQLAPELGTSSTLAVLDKRSPPRKVREQLAGITRRCADATWEYLYAASRSLRGGGPEVGARAVLLARGAEMLGNAFLSPLGVLTTERILGSKVEEPAEKLLAGRVDAMASRGALRLGLDPTERWSVCVDRLRGVLRLEARDRDTQYLRGAAASLFLWAVAQRSGPVAAHTAHEKEAALFQELPPTAEADVALLLTGLGMGVR